MVPFLSMILVLWLALLHSSLTSLKNQMQHSCLWYFKGQWNNWIWDHYLYICWHQRTICLFTITSLSFTMIWGSLFQSSSLWSELWRKSGGKIIIIGDWVEFCPTSWNPIDIPIHVFESNVSIVQNSLCTEAEKKEYGFSLGKGMNFAVCHHFLMPFLVELLLPKKNLTMNSLPFPRSATIALEVPPISMTLDLRKSFFFGTGSFGSVSMIFKSSPRLLNTMVTPNSTMNYRNLLRIGW